MQQLSDEIWQLYEHEVLPRYRKFEVERERLRPAARRAKVRCISCAVVAAGLFILFLVGAREGIQDDQWSLSTDARAAVLLGVATFGLLSFGVWRAAVPIRFALTEEAGRAFLEPVCQAFDLHTEFIRDKMDSDLFHDLLDHVVVSHGEPEEDPEPTHVHFGRNDRHQMEVNVSADRIYIAFHGLSYVPGIITVEPRKESGRRIRHNREGKRHIQENDPEFREIMEARGTIPVPARRYLNDAVRLDLLRFLRATAPYGVVFQLQRNRLLMIINRPVNPMFPLNPLGIDAPARAFQAVVEETAFVRTIWDAFLTSSLATTVPFPVPED